jgi:hypothetical protein
MEIRAFQATRVCLFKHDIFFNFRYTKIERTRCPYEAAHAMPESVKRINDTDKLQNPCFINTAELRYGTSQRPGPQELSQSSTTWDQTLPS